MIKIKWFVRYKSNVPPNKVANSAFNLTQSKANTTDRKNPGISSEPLKGSLNLNRKEWKQIEGFIPGEKKHVNTLSERMPQFPLGKENVPTLLPKPGIPRVGLNADGKTLNFRQVLSILKNKTNEELIYESEPHRLYFLFSFCFGLTLLIYGIVLGEWAIFQANEDFKENKEEKNETLRKRDWVLNLGKYSIFSGIIFTCSYLAFTFPAKLIRRIYYLPGPVEHIKFTTYPMFPGRPTPVITVPLKNLERKYKARVWTGKGFYGTSDKSLFYFTLMEKNNNGKTIKNWVVDRRGFFWSDGRIFDYLFGKELIAESEAGIPYDEQVGIVNRELKKKKEKLRKQHGVFWNFKLVSRGLKDDIKRLSSKEISKKN